MLSTTFFSAFLALAAVTVAQNQTTGKLGDAAPVDDNPTGASYFAVLPNSLKQPVRGSIVAISAPDGKGVDFSISFANLPAEGGPFKYHLHDQPVPADGNCTGTLAHLDPYIRGEATPCDSSKPATCQVGDLSGKHGAVKERAFVATYNDPYASLKEGIGAFFGNRSFVIHYNNSTRITCANFTRISEGRARKEIDDAKSAAMSAIPSQSASASDSKATASSASNATASLTTTAIASATASSSASATSSVPLAQSSNAAVGLMAPLPVVGLVAAAMAML